jgi:two-component system, chemotaxis family, sensor kinase Cph1
MRAGLVRIRESQSLDALCAETARELLELTGFDRVLVYKFRPDLTGEVVAESGAEQRYLGLRFPASDIPAQARALYTACRSRMTPTSTYVPARLVGIDDGRPVDMTHAALRSVSPVHLQYMRNMGVSASSMGISLIVDGRLWGLVTCNHESGEHFVPYRARMSCALIGEMVSSLIGQKIQTASANGRVESLKIGTSLTQSILRCRDVVRGLTEQTPSLQDVTSSAGAVIYYRAEVHVVGNTPPLADIMALLSWLDTHGHSTVAFDSLPAHYPPAHAWKHVGCGLVATRIARPSILDGDYTWLLWFRPELFQTVGWGGDPDKVTSLGPLSPRSSFEKWTQDVHLTSAPFTPFELDAARAFAAALSDAILEIEASRRIEEAARIVEETNQRLVLQIAETQRAELELRRAQKLEAVGRLASGIAHEINTPVQYVTDSITFVQEALSELASLMPGAPARPPDAEEIDVEFLLDRVPRAIERSLDGLKRIATLVHAMKDFAHPDSTVKEPCDLNRAITATCDVARGEIRDVATLSLDLGVLPPVPCFLGDLNQAVLNLIVNSAHAIADTLGGTRTRGAIAVRSWCENDDVFITIRDDGGGIPEAIREQIFLPFFTTKPVGRGTGQGLAISRSLVVDKHGGSLTFESEPGCTTFTIRIPIGESTRQASGESGR